MVAMLGIATPVIFQAGLEEGGDGTLNDNETVDLTPAGDVKELQDSNIDGAFYNETVRVFDSAGTEMTEGTDYEWFARNGTIQAISGGGLDGESSANVTYGYVETTDTQRETSDLLAQAPTVMGFALPFLALLVFARVVG